MTISADDPRPSYAQIADHLRSGIQAGRYSNGERRLPAVKALAAEYGVAQMTVYRALEVLIREGYVVAQQGRGTFVREVLPTAEPDNLPDAAAFGAVNQRVDELFEELGECVRRQEVEDLRRNVARLENLLMELYSRTGQPYPHQRPDDEGRQRVGA